MLIVLHGFIFFSVLYRLLNFFTYRVLVYDAGIPYSIAPVLTFVLVGIFGAVLAKYLRWL